MSCKIQELQRIWAEIESGSRFYAGAGHHVNAWSGSTVYAHRGCKEYHRARCG